MVSHYPAKRHCGNGDVMVLVGKEENCRYSCFYLPLLFIFKNIG